MKVCIIQPKYSYDPSELDECYEAFIRQLDECDDSLDVIVAPEYSDALANVHGKEGLYGAIEKYNESLLAAASATAKRCHALLFINAAYMTEDGARNTTHVFDREGRLIDRYFKAHPAPSEVRRGEDGGYGVDVGYSYEFSAPHVLEIEGIRFGFLTCYDFYFYENFARIAKENLDVIIGCSLQRTDTHEALSIINRFLCYNTNAYLLRSSVSLGEDSQLCGSSMVVAPDGREIGNMKSRVGRLICEIDPKDKYYKPAGHGGALKSHYEYIEEGRRPWLYRNGGASVVPGEGVMKYPRICAHRGFNTVAPENSLPAYGAAISLGADEIEFDLWSTTDGVLVSSHDATLERTSNGKGYIYDHSFAELQRLDFGVNYGVKYGKGYEGLGILTFEDILKKFAGRTVMNIHVKIWDRGFADEKIPEIVGLLRKYDCASHAYFMSSNADALVRAREYAPEIAICMGCNGKIDPIDLVKKAIGIGAKKLQFYRPAAEPTQESIRLAHEHGIRCNVCETDDPALANKFIDMGIDTVMTNDFLCVYNAIKDRLHTEK